MKFGYSLLAAAYLSARVLGSDRYQSVETVERAQSRSSALQAAAASDVENENSDETDDLSQEDETDDLPQEDKRVALRGSSAAPGNQRQLSSCALPDVDAIPEAEFSGADKQVFHLIRNKPEVLVKNKKWGVLSNFGENFRVKFDFCLNGPGSARFQNLIHLTAGPNYLTPGSRIPAVFYDKERNSIQFATSESYLIKHHLEVFDVRKVNFRVWVKVAISRWNGIYEIKVDDKVVHQKPSHFIRSYPKVSVFASNPFSNAPDGLIRKLKISSKKGNGVGHATLIAGRPELPVRKQSLTVLKNYGRDFLVRFSFCLNSAGKGTPWANLIHLTTGPNVFALGSRIPGVWYNSHTKALTFVNSDLPDAKKNWTFDHSFDEYGKWFDLEISSVKGKFSIKLNQQELTHAAGQLAQKYPEVFVYFSDPWYVPVDGALRDLAIKF